MAETPQFDSNGRLVAKQTQGDNAQPLSVSEISGALKRVVEDRFGHVRIRGEISGFKRAASGHIYLALKDDKANIDGVMWRGTSGRLAFAPEDGLDVIVTGKLTTYPGRSKYQIVIESMELAGEGALMALFEKLKAKLRAEGLFEQDRKRPIPYLPRTIGIVTSPTGSVIRDILHRLADRMPSHVIVWPVLVQGEGAAEQVARAVEGFGMLGEGDAMPRPDLLIVARGGGSIEDLWAFNEEVAVRAIAESAIPVISAVGHETDTTLADFAADLRAPTPTAAAEMAVPVRADLLAGLAETQARGGRAVRRLLSQASERLTMQARLLPRLTDLLSPHRQRLDDAGEGLENAMRHRLSDKRQALAVAGGGLRPALVTRRIETARERLDARWAMLQQLHPHKPLERGYVQVSGADGAVMTRREQAAGETKLTLTFADGALDTVPVGQAAPIPQPKPKARRKKPADDRQEDLF